MPTGNYDVIKIKYYSIQQNIHNFLLIIALDFIFHLDIYSENGKNYTHNSYRDRITIFGFSQFSSIHKKKNLTRHKRFSNFFYPVTKAIILPVSNFFIILDDQQNVNIEISVNPLITSIKFHGNRSTDSDEFCEREWDFSWWTFESFILVAARLQIFLYRKIAFLRMHCIFSCSSSFCSLLSPSRICFIYIHTLNEKRYGILLKWGKALLNRGNVRYGVQHNNILLLACIILDFIMCYAVWCSLHKSIKEWHENTIFFLSEAHKLCKISRKTIHFVVGLLLLLFYKLHFLWMVNLCVQCIPVYKDWKLYQRKDITWISYTFK